MKIFPQSFTILFALILMACNPSANKTSTGTDELTTESFIKSMQTFCGKELKGEIVADSDNPQNIGKNLLYSFNQCTDKEIRITVQLHDKQKKTIILTLMGEEILLKHDMRNADMSPAEYTMFGGFSGESGTDSKQIFPVHNFGGDMWPGFENYSWIININSEESYIEYKELSENLVKKHYIIRLPEAL